MEVVENKKLDIKVYKETLDNGCQVIIIPRKDSKGFKKESNSLFVLNLDDYKESKHHISISIHLKWNS